MLLENPAAIPFRFSPFHSLSQSLHSPPPLLPSSSSSLSSAETHNLSFSHGLYCRHILRLALMTFCMCTPPTRTYPLYSLSPLDHQKSLSQSPSLSSLLCCTLCTVQSPSAELNCSSPSSFRPPFALFFFFFSLSLFADHFNWPPPLLSRRLPSLHACVYMSVRRAIGPSVEHTHTNARIQTPCV